MRAYQIGDNERVLILNYMTLKPGSVTLPPTRNTFCTVKINVMELTRTYEVYNLRHFVLHVAWKLHDDRLHHFSNASLVDAGHARLEQQLRRKSRLILPK